MPASPEERVRQVRERIDALQRERARRELELEAARASQERVRERLRTEFGVETPEQAQLRMEELEQELEKLLTEAGEALRRAANSE